MPKYKGTVCRTSYSFRTIEVEADNDEQAQEKILDEAGNHEYSEKNVEYSLDGGVQREFLKQTLEFDYKGKKFKFEFTPEEEDLWTAFKQHGIEFDIHYFENEDNNKICVYLDDDEERCPNSIIHIQKIKR